MIDLIKHDNQEPSLDLHDLGERPWISEQSVDIHEIWPICRRRLWQIVLIALAVFVPVAIVTFSMTPLYRSTTSLQIDAEPAKVMPYLDLTQGMASSNFELFMRTKDELLRSDTLARRTLRALQTKAEQRGREDFVDGFSSMLEIQRAENSQVVFVSFSDPDAELAAQVANTFANEFMDFHLEKRIEINERAKEFLESELGKLKTRLEAAEQQMVEYATANGLLDVKGQGVNAGEQGFSFLNDEMSKAEANLISTQAALESTNQVEAEDFPGSLKTEAITTLEGRLLVLEQDLSALLVQFGKNWPAVRQKEQEVELVRGQLEEAKQDVLSSLRTQGELDLRTAERQYQLLAAATRRLEDRVKRLDEASIEYNILQREVQTNQELYLALLQRLKETSVSAGLEFGNIHVIDPAVPRYRPDRPKVYWNLGIALFLGLGLGVCGAFFFEFLDSTLKVPEDLEKRMGLPSLGVIPPIPTGRHLKNSRWESPVPSLLPDRIDAVLCRLDDKPVGEAYRSLSAALCLSKGDARPRSILITSAVPEEGKTTTVMNLGVTLARNGFRTVLVDLDFRRPALANRLGLRDSPGLTTFLSGNQFGNGFPEIQETAVPNLYVLPTGPKPPNPVSLLGSERLVRSLQNLVAEFDFVLLDSAPVLTVADAWLVAPKVDGVVMVVRAEETREQLVRKATSKLYRVGARILGVTLNNAREAHRAYTDYGYYQGYDA